ncbi:uncharacterized protein LOC132803425 [Ziziphus jujuba]|uniref:Uncharacterized protein LOC132803425 n=1 Tax=Ziziphus jujuba TaxID=326968 RepID=A0ABM4A6Q7_ZIZJJ|nr:uncharacterized protein LOC132803425 [Ziziphus jujuba]
MTSRIYLDAENVIHFTQGRRGARSDDPHSTCPKCRDHDQSSVHGVVYCCIDCFDSGADHLYLFEYGVNPAFILAKLGGGTTLALADQPDVVLNHALNFLTSSDSNSHYRFINNGKDFAILWSFKVRNIVTFDIERENLQPGDHIYTWTRANTKDNGNLPLLLLFQSTAATFIGVAATCSGLYCIYGFRSDIGARLNIIKVDQVETLLDVDDKNFSSAASGVRPIESLIDLFIVLLMTHVNFQLLLTVRV